MLRLYHQFGNSNGTAGKGNGIFYRTWMLAWMICLAAMLWGCGVSGGGDQITKMNEKYLAEQGSQSPSPEGDSSKGGEKTEAPEDGTDGKRPQDSQKPGQASSQKPGKDLRDESPSDGKSHENAASSSKNHSQREKSTVSNSRSESKKSSAEKSKAKRKKSSSAKLSPGIAREDEDVSRSEDSKDEEKREEDKKDGEGIHCFVSIDCLNILSHMSKLKESKKDYVPKDGIILKKTEVTVKPGTSAYDVLYQACRERNIHLEAAYTPMYGTYYVEGIHQLYEFDCGDLSGWNYMVNGRQPSVGCSKYQVRDGDVIAWRFTCDRGKDLQ